MKTILHLKHLLIMCLLLSPCFAYAANGGAAPVVFPGIHAAGVNIDATSSQPTGGVGTQSVVSTIKSKMSTALNKTTSILANNTMGIIGDIRSLVLGFSALLGLILLISGLSMANEVAVNPQNQQGQSYGAAGVMCAVGIALMQMYTLIDISSTSLFGSGTFSWVRPDNAAVSTKYGNSQVLALASAMWLQVTGVVMMVIGMHTLTKVGKSQDVTYGQAFSRLIAGLMLANIFTTTRLWSSFTGFNDPFLILGIA